MFVFHVNCLFKVVLKPLGFETAHVFNDFVHPLALSFIRSLRLILLLIWCHVLFNAFCYEYYCWFCVLKHFLFLEVYLTNHVLKHGLALHDPEVKLHRAAHPQFSYISLISSLVPFLNLNCGPRFGYVRFISEDAFTNSRLVFSQGF